MTTSINNSRKEISNKILEEINFLKTANLSLTECIAVKEINTTSQAEIDNVKNKIRSIEDDNKIINSKIAKLTADKEEKDHELFQ